METFLYIVFFLSCVLLIVSVLLQPGKTDAGALFTSNVASAALNPRGTASVLSKMTIAMAAIFMLSALLLSLPAITGKVSVLETQGEQPASSQEAATNVNTENSEGTPQASPAGNNAGEGAGAPDKPASDQSKEKTAEESKSDSEK